MEGADFEGVSPSLEESPEESLSLEESLEDAFWICVIDEPRLGRGIILNFLVLRQSGRLLWGNFLGGSRLERSSGKYTERSGRIRSTTFPLALVPWMATFGRRESDSESESEESSEADLTAGVFTTGLDVGFDFRGLAACGEGVSERGMGGSDWVLIHWLRLLR